MCQENRPLDTLDTLDGAEGDVALVAAVGLVGNGAGEEALGQKRIEILPSRLLLRIAQEGANLGDASRLVHAEKENLVLDAVRDPVAGNRRNHRGIAAVMPVDKGRTDIQIVPKNHHDITVTMLLLFGDQEKRDAHVLLHQVLQPEQETVQLPRLERFAGRLGSSVGKMRKLHRIARQLPMNQAEGIPSPLPLQAGNHLFIDAVITLQRFDAVGRIIPLKEIFLFLGRIEDIEKRDLDRRLHGHPRDLIRAVGVPGSRVVVREKPRGVIFFSHGNSSRSAFSHRRCRGPDSRAEQGPHRCRCVPPLPRSGRAPDETPSPAPPSGAPEPH